MRDKIWLFKKCIIIEGYQTVTYVIGKGQKKKKTVQVGLVEQSYNRGRNINCCHLYGQQILYD